MLVSKSQHIEESVSKSWHIHALVSKNRKHDYRNLSSKIQSGVRHRPAIIGNQILSQIVRFRRQLKDDPLQKGRQDKVESGFYIWSWRRSRRISRSLLKVVLGALVKTENKCLISNNISLLETEKYYIVFLFSSRAEFQISPKTTKYKPNKWISLFCSEVFAAKPKAGVRVGPAPIERWEGFTECTG